MKTDKKLPLPANEAERLAVLKSYDILDTLPEKDFDAITKLASYICGAPIALISLLDENRQWFKSTVGLEATETARNISFCQYAIMDNTVFEVPDAQKDERFIANPLVTADPNIRFYAGAPLIMLEGLPIGTLCVIDREPKVLTDEQKEALQTLANEVVSHIILRKQKRNLEKEKARLSEALQVKEQFLANMSHEIRTPMNGILGLTNLLLHTQLNEEQRTYLQHIKNCTDNLTVIINDILEFSKLEAGKVTFEAIPFDIGELINSIVCLHTPKTREKGLFMQTHISADVLRRMVGDPARLAQILHNLIGNAIKFTREGKINVLVACKEQTAENIQLLFTVEETAHAIQEEIEKYFRAGSDDYLAKPFHAEELINKIENLVMTPRL